MGLWQWLMGRGAAHVDSRLRRWREHWLNAAASSEHTDIARLTNELNAFDFPEDEIEIEREMLQALIEREQLASSIRESGLPRVETGHRVVRGEPCHYSEPTSMPDDAGQPSGRLLMTASRAFFVGSGQTVAAAWHTISAVLQTERDLVLVKNGHEHAYRFRCNSYGDALRAAFIAREILNRCHGSTRTRSATDHHGPNQPRINTDRHGPDPPTDQHGSTRTGSATDEPSDQHGSAQPHEVVRGFSWLEFRVSPCSSVAC